MAEGYTLITPEPIAGQRGTDWMRWLDSYAATHAQAVAQMTVRDFPAWVAAHIAEEEDGYLQVTLPDFERVLLFFKPGHRGFVPPI